MNRVIHTRKLYVILHIWVSVVCTIKHSFPQGSTLFSQCSDSLRKRNNFLRHLFKSCLSVWYNTPILHFKLLGRLQSQIQAGCFLSCQERSARYIKVIFFVSQSYDVCMYLSSKINEFGKVVRIPLLF